MSTYHSLLNCMEVKEVVHDGPDDSATKATHRRAVGFHSFITWTDASASHRHAFMEAALSPVKYALFQYLGFLLLLAVNPTISSHLSPTSSAKIGALGGTLLALLYFVLLLKVTDSKTEEPTGESLAFLLTALVKEMAYSGLAAAIGAVGYGLPQYHYLSVVSTAGVLGPVVFLIVMFGLLGSVLCVAWFCRSIRDWHARIF